MSLNDQKAPAVQHTSDEQLVGLFGSTGDSRHFDELVRRHIGKVRSMVYSMVMNNADADDLTQEIFVRAAKGLRSFRGDARFSSWLYRIATNTTCSFLNKCRRSCMEYRSETPEVADGNPVPGERMAAREDDRGVEEAMASLSPSLRSAIVLTAIQDMSVREAAKVEGCLTATMYWRVHRARRILRTKLGRIIHGKRN